MKRMRKISMGIYSNGRTAPNEMLFPFVDNIYYMDCWNGNSWSKLSHSYLSHLDLHFQERKIKDQSPKTTGCEKTGKFYSAPITKTFYHTKQPDVLYSKKNKLPELYISWFDEQFLTFVSYYQIYNNKGQWVFILIICNSTLKAEKPENNDASV